MQRSSSANTAAICSIAWPSVDPLLAQIVTQAAASRSASGAPTVAVLRPMLADRPDHRLIELAPHGIFESGIEAG
jgi:hypothetical protein